jgi:hypothetical protein
MIMLPFTIKDTNQPVERLCRMTSHQLQNLDVDVRLLLHRCEVRQLHTFSRSTRRLLHAEILKEARRYAEDAFITLLRGIAEPEIFLPTELLNRYPHRRYCLLLSPRGSRELSEICNIDGRYRQYLVAYGDYELVVDAKPQLTDTEAYLINPTKYTLFLRQVNEADTISVYRSDFIDLTANTAIPLDLHAQDVIDTIRNGIEAALEQQPRWHPSPTPQVEADETPATVTECPRCCGPVQRIGQDSFFCLDCDWDNLRPLV